MVQPANAGDGSTSPVGSGEYEVRAGECVMSIAFRSGHFWETIWNDPANDAIKQKRGSPHVLMPGDKLHVPELRVKQESRATESRHRFRRKGVPLMFEVLAMEDDEPLAGCPYVLHIDRFFHSKGEVPDDGVIAVSLPPDASEGELRIMVDGKTRIFPLQFGHLDPPHTEAGAMGRLQNLGLLGEDADENSFKESLKRFQKSQQLDPTGELDDDTAAALAEAHGS